MSQLDPTWDIPPPPEAPEAGKDSGLWIWRWRGCLPDESEVRDIDWRWRWVPPGKGVQGSRGWDEREEPRHEVEFAAGFWLMEHPVTQLQYLSLMGENPSEDGDKSDWQRRPVNKINWFNADALCEHLQAAAKEAGVSFEFRLPWEREWEYACRAGSIFDYALGDGEAVLHRMAWYYGNLRFETNPVCSKQSNNWELCDMHGNVFEWCLDRYDRDAYRQKRRGVEGDGLNADENHFRLMRGGYAGNTAPVCRSAFRDWWRAGDRDWGLGMRAGGFPGPAKPQKSEGGQARPAKQEKRDGQTKRNVPPEGEIFLEQEVFFDAAGDEDLNPSQVLSVKGDFEADVLDPNTNPAWESITIIVLGRLKPDENKTVCAGLKQVHQWPPNLRHLHLWNCKELTAITNLPEGLVELDTRGCSQLETVELKGNKLTTLDLEGCDKLTCIPTDLSELKRLFLGGEEHPLPALTVLQLLQSAGKLQELQLKGLRNLEKIACLPSNLLRVWIINNSKLKKIGSGPASSWPQGLRTLDLSGNLQLASVPPLPVALDYLDLRHCTELGELPLPHPPHQALGELHLYGSGISYPPEAVHKGDGENAIHAVRDFFQGIEEVGTSRILRSKVLVLGNGNAGKSVLCRRLQARWIESQPQKNRAELPDSDPPQPGEGRDSTHGIIFRPMDTQALVHGAVETVSLDLWDFGGQELYHNTHRLFAQTGSVFLLVINPGETQPEKEASGHEDVHQSPQYWIDYIRSVVANPRIAAVVTRRASNTEDRDVWKDGLSGCEDIETFYVDSIANAGQLEEVEAWLAGASGKTIERHGSRIPKHWQIANDLCNLWIAENTQAEARGESPVYTEVGFDSFSGILRQELLQHGLPEEKAEELCKPDRIRYLLDALTAFGTIYWRSDLFEQRIIIGKKWVLDGIYALLERKEKDGVWEKIAGNEGRFTQEELSEWYWAANGYADKGQQQLMLSFMEQAKLCVRLDMERDYLRGQDFVSLRHLPQSRTELDAKFHARSIGERKQIKFEFEILHQGHWDEMMVRLIQKFSRAGTYTSHDTYLFGETLNLKITFSPSESWVGGAIRIVAISKDDQASQAACEDMKAFLLNSERAPRERIIEQDLSQEFFSSTKTPRVFITYAWNKTKNDSHEQIAVTISNYMADLVSKKQVEFFRDVEWSKEMKKKGLGRMKVTEFMKDIAKGDKIIMVSSDSYWKGIMCMFEAYHLLIERINQREALDDILIMIRHESCTVRKSTDRYVNHWETVAEEDSWDGNAINSLWKKKNTTVNANILTVLDLFADTLINKCKGDLWPSGKSDDDAEKRAKDAKKRAEILDEIRQFVVPKSLQNQPK